VRRRQGRIRRVLAQRYALPGRYRPERYWQARAAELTERYDDDPAGWEQIGWMRGGVEEELVVTSLRELGCSSVLVCGAGSGRQYSYLVDAGFSVEGFDISPSLVEECRRRFPAVRTTRASVLDAELEHEPHDAVVTSAVLQHVPPPEIAQAMSVVKGLARKAIVIRETTQLAHASTYQWAHDYAAVTTWSEARRETTDERPGVRVELIAFRPTGHDS
jgi:2-polyprenyl-3-methyl-5-hydroxy-6-metoxy-1,4-benzoquinol methylase